MAEAPSSVAQRVSPANQREDSAEDREWKARLSLIEARICAERPQKSTLTASPAAVSSAAKRAASGLPAPHPKAKPTPRPSAKRESSLLFLSREVARRVASATKPHSRRTPPKPPVAAAPKPTEARAAPQRPHAADPTDYDVHVISAYLPPPVPTPSAPTTPATPALRRTLWPERGTFVLGLGVTMLLILGLGWHLGSTSAREAAQQTQAVAAPAAPR
jgi:hypothetical protein